MDNSMLEQFKDDYGVVIVTFANILMHFVPPPGWFTILVLDKKSIHKYYTDNTITTCILQTILLPTYFILSYLDILIYIYIYIYI